MSNDPNPRRATPLAGRLQARIQANGPISIADYMQTCLQDPEHGYYSKPATVGRDFTTAPEISQIFGELIGLWCVIAWQQMGRPDPVHLVELGPGRGTMMRDMLRSLHVASDFLSAVAVHLVESSTSLTAAQRHLLQGSPVGLHWHSDLRELPKGACIVIANEFLDALPARQYIRTMQGWAERAIAVDAHGQLRFTAVPGKDGAAIRLVSERFAEAQPGDIAETRDLVHLAKVLCARAAEHSLVALLIDYGHTTSASGDTLQAVRENHYEHPLTSPGEADLTMQVDLAAVAQAFAASRSVIIDGPVTQAELLGALGMAERASRLMAANPAKANAIETGVQRLMAPAGMGTRFKAIGIRSVSLPPLPGLDRREAATQNHRAPCRGD